MAAQQTNDELNILDGSLTRRAVLDILTFFGEMDLTDEQKEKRIRMAQEMETFLAMLLLMLQAEIRLGNGIDRDYYYNYAESRLKETAEANLTYSNESNITDNMKDTSNSTSKALQSVKKALSSSAVEFIRSQVIDIVDSTIKNSGDSYYFSGDRARLIAENEANGICNADELDEAIRNGYKYKAWNTMQDGRVRHTHMMVDGDKVGIKDAFTVGRCKMLAPLIFDEDSPQDAKEIVNCRCSLIYLKK